MADKLYLIGVEFCEASVIGPFESEEERDNEAREYMSGSLCGDTNVFKLYVDDDRNVTMGVYLDGEFDDEDEEDGENEDD